MKLEVNQLVSFVALGLLGWASMQVYQMNAQLTVTSYKVEENYNMIKPMWQDFLVRNAFHDQSRADDGANLHATKGK
jgi:hypothetical protein